MKREEIEKIREAVSCAAVLEQAGFAVDMKESTRRAVKFRKGAEIIIVTHEGRGWFDPLPAGVGVKETSEIMSDLVEPCENLRRGSAMFAKILRIVRKWYGNPTSAEVFPQIFDDAVYAWNTGQIEGQGVFQAEDPGGAVPEEVDKAKVVEAEPADAAPTETEAEPSNANDIGGAGIRIDLSRIGVQK